jgi:hypothetical protein
MSEQWLTFREAVEIVRGRLGASIGRSEAVTNAARASGEVRFHNPANPVLLTSDDGVVGMSLRTGRNGRMITTADTFQISREDLLDWLSRQAPQQPTRMPAPEPKPRARNKRARVEAAIQALWPNRLPDQTVLPNALLCKKVQDWLKDDSKSRGVPAQVISDDTILRAAGRK